MNTQAFKALVDKVLADHPSREAEIFAYRLIIEVLSSVETETLTLPSKRPSKSKGRPWSAERRASGIARTTSFNCKVCGTPRMGSATQKFCSATENAECRKSYWRKYNLDRYKLMQAAARANPPYSL